MWFGSENKIEKQVILVQIKTKRVVRTGPLQVLGSFTVTPFLLKMIRIQKLSNHNDTMCPKHQWRKCQKEKRFYWHNLSHSAGPWRWRQTALKNRESDSEVCVWDVNSTVTKYSGYFFWKNTSKRVTRRSDTSWQEASEFLCIKTPPFLREFSIKKIRQNPPEMLSPTRY